MNKYSLSMKFIAGLLLFAIVSCKDKEKDKLYDELNKGFENSNELIKWSTQKEYKLIADKLAKASSHEQATIWYPKAIKIKSLSENLFQQLEQIKTNLKNGSINQKSSNLDKVTINKVYTNLLQYQKEVLSEDSEIYNTFNKRLTISSGPLDSTEKTEQDFSDTYFYKNNKSTKQLITALSKLQNNIIIIENEIVTFCELKINDGFCGYDVFEELVSQNSNHFKVGEKIVITAGVGAYSTRVLPKIFINGKIRNINAEGFVRYNTIVPTNPGKYYIPVKINFKKPDGTDAIMEKQIEYTVDE